MPFSQRTLFYRLVRVFLLGVVLVTTSEGYSQMKCSDVVGVYYRVDLSKQVGLYDRMKIEREGWIKYKMAVFSHSSFHLYRKLFGLMRYLVSRQMISANGHRHPLELINRGVIQSIRIAINPQFGKGTVKSGEKSVLLPRGESNRETMDLHFAELRSLLAEYQSYKSKLKRILTEVRVETKKIILALERLKSSYKGNYPLKITLPPKIWARYHEGEVKDFNGSTLVKGSEEIIIRNPRDLDLWISELKKENSPALGIRGFFFRDLKILERRQAELERILLAASKEIAYWRTVNPVRYSEQFADRLVFADQLTEALRDPFLRPNGWYSGDLSTFFLRKEAEFFAGGEREFSEEVRKLNEQMNAEERADLNLDRKSDPEKYKNLFVRARKAAISKGHSYANTLIAALVAYGVSSVADAFFEIYPRYQDLGKLKPAEYLESFDSRVQSLIDKEESLNGVIYQNGSITLPKVVTSEALRNQIVRRVEEIEQREWRKYITSRVLHLVDARELNTTPEFATFMTKPQFQRILVETRMKLLGTMENHKLVAQLLVNQFPSLPKGARDQVQSWLGGKPISGPLTASHPTLVDKVQKVVDYQGKWNEFLEKNPEPAPEGEKNKVQLFLESTE